MIGHIWHDRYYMLAFILKQNKPLQVVLKLDQGGSERVFQVKGAWFGRV